MKRNILLVEPGYKNKYPPIGLMKIATYHKLLGDNVTFYKGDIKDFIVDQITEDCVKKLQDINDDYLWSNKKNLIKKYIKTKHSKYLIEILPKISVEDIILYNQVKLFEIWLKFYADFYKKKKYENEPKWDRIYITTLFTFYWKITIKTINDAKCLIKDLNQLKIGGILASLLKNEVYLETGIKPFAGILDKPKLLDDNNYIIDDLPLDYSILDEIDYKYPTGSAYFTFMTKGCTRSCAFCSVPKLEPTYKDKIPTKNKFNEIKSIFGEQQNLLLMDNNVLASPKFPEIIREVKEMGFVKGAKFIEPNQLDISIKNLKNGINDKAYIKKTFLLLKEFLDQRVKEKTAQSVYDIYSEFNLIKIENVTKQNLLGAYVKLKEIYEKYRSKTPKKRYVDFNQGTDARYINEENMRLLSEIPINPLRIAFDYWGIKDQYERAVRLAAKYKIKRLSNYLLFNFKDKPEDLYNRILFNVNLSEELNIHIYSFPMKYIPLFGEDAKNRNFIGKYWNKKFIRAIQSISNVTRGIVPPGRSFFERAWGRDLNEFIEILYMPETFIVYRKLFDEDLGLTGKWREIFHSLNKSELLKAKEIIISNDFTGINRKTRSKRIQKLLEFYNITRDDVKKSDSNYLSLKEKFNHLIQNDKFLNLTLTYDNDENTTKNNLYNETESNNVKRRNRASNF